MAEQPSIESNLRFQRRRQKLALIAEGQRNELDDAMKNPEAFSVASRDQSLTITISTYAKAIDLKASIFETSHRKLQDSEHVH